MTPRTKKKSRRGYGEGSVSQVKTGRNAGLWVGRLEGGIDPTTGKRLRITVTSRDFNEMKTKLETAKSQLKEVGYVADARVTVREWTERWLTEIRTTQVAGKTYATDASQIRKHVQPVIGSKRLASLTPADVRSVREGMVNKGLSTSSALRAYRVLSKCLEDARRENLVTQNVTDRVDAPIKADSERGSFTVEQTIDILTKAAAFDGSRHITRLLTGVRQSEALGLTLDAVDLDAGVAQIRWQLQELQYKHGCGRRAAGGIYPCGRKRACDCSTPGWQVKDGAKYRILAGRMALTEPKSKAGVRAVPLIPPVVAAIRQHLANTDGQPNPYGLIWHAESGAPIAHKDDQAEWQDLVESAGLPRTCTTHWARHSVATLLNQAGVDTMIIAEIVGHGAAAATEDYIHISSTQAVEAMNRLDRMLTS